MGAHRWADVVDLIVTRPPAGSAARAHRRHVDMSESRHLAGRKWRATWNGIHLDLYVPFESRLGLNLQLRVETLVRQTQTVDRYQLLVPEAHLATKIAALLDRPDSQPGQKDRLEIRRLLTQPKVAERTPAVIHAASTRSPAELAVLTRQAVAYLAESTDVAKAERQGLLRLKQLWASYFETANPAEHSLPPDGPSVSPRL